MEKIRVWVQHVIMGSLVVGSVYESQAILFLLFFILNLFDFVMKLFLKEIKHIEIDTGKEILMKFSLWIIIGIAFIASFSLTKIGSVVNIDLTFSQFLGWLVLSSLMINEAKSIIKNISALGIKVPSILIKVLTTAKDKLSDEDDGEKS